MSNQPKGALGDVVRAFAASDFLAGAAVALTELSRLVRTQELKDAIKVRALRLQAQSVIEFDRAITEDPRGVKRALLDC